MDSGWGIHLREPAAIMNTFLTAFDHVPDLRAENARHELRELLVVAFVSVLCGATSCVEMSAFGRAKAHIFRDFLRLKHEIPSHDTFSPVFRMIDPKALDAAFGQIFADVEALMADGDVVAIDWRFWTCVTGSGCAMSLACRRTAVWRRTSLPWRPHCPGGVDGGALRPHARSKTAPVQVLLLRGPILVETPPRHRPRRGLTQDKTPAGRPTGRRHRMRAKNPRHGEPTAQAENFSVMNYCG